MAQDLALATRRGGVLWAINSLRADGLSSLLDDLVDVEKRGLERQHCELVKSALDKLANRASDLPDGSFWRRKIYQEIEEFGDIYEEWNAKEGPSGDATAHRKQALKKLRQCRNNIATRIRKNGYVLQNELDLKLVNDMYSALGELSKSVPEIFKQIGKAFDHYNKKREANP